MADNSAEFLSLIALHFDPALRQLHLKTIGTGEMSGADRDLLDARAFQDLGDLIAPRDVSLNKKFL